MPAGARKPQTSRRSSSLLNTRVGSEARTRSRVNSFFARWTSRSPTVTLRRDGSIRISPDPHRAVVAAVAAAQDGGDPRPQLVVAERLLDVVVGAEVEAADPVGGAAAAGQDDDRQARVVAGVDAVGLADLAQDVEAGGVGQRQVEQQQVGMVVAAEAQRVGGARGRAGPRNGRPSGARRAGRGWHRRPRRRRSWRSLLLGQHARVKGLGRGAISPPSASCGRCGEGGGDDASGGELEHGDGAPMGDEAARRDRAADLEDSSVRARGSRRRARSACRRCGPRRNAGSAAPARPSSRSSSARPRRRARKPTATGTSPSATDPEGRGIESRPCPS